MCNQCPCLSQAARETVLSLDEVSFISNGRVLDAEMGTLIALLWADPNVQLAFHRRAEYQLNDSTQ